MEKMGGGWPPVFVKLRENMSKTKTIDVQS